MTISLKANAAGTQGEIQLNGTPVAEFTANTVNFPGLAQSLAGNGYVKLPGGLILQWGLEDVPGTPTTYNFPIPFPNGIFSIVASARPMAAAASANAINLSTSQFQLAGLAFAGGYTPVAINWIAIGY